MKLSRAILTLTLLHLSAMAGGKDDDGNQLVSVINSPSNPVPTVTVGIVPFQKTFGITTQAGDSGEDCSEIEVPEGMVLTLHTLGFRASSNGSSKPYVYLRLIRDTGNQRTIRRIGDVADTLAVSSSGVFTQANMQIRVFIGPFVDGGGEYEGEVCINAPSENSTFHSTTGVVSGELSPGLIADGGR